MRVFSAVVLDPFPSSSISWEDVCLFSSTHTPNTSWYIDSDATHYMTFDKSFFSYTSISPISIGVANGNTLSAVGVGSVHVFGTHSVCVFENVLHVPGLAHNLFSTS